MLRVEHVIVCNRFYACMNTVMYERSILRQTTTKKHCYYRWESISGLSALTAPFLKMDRLSISPSLLKTKV